jgi:hypothetical protein
VLTKPEKSEVLTEFATVVALDGDGRALSQIIFQGEAPEVLRDLPVGALPNSLFALHVVDFCLKSEWTKTPSLMSLLLGYLVNTTGIGRFQAQLDRVNLKVDPNPDPYKSEWVLQAFPFFDRVDLRARVKQLLQQTARPLLRVTAPEDSYGRTYGRQFLDHLEEALSNGTHFVTAELSSGNARLYDVRDLAETLAGQLEVSDGAPAPDASSYPAALARWVLRNAVARPGLWVFVLDGFGQQGVKRDVCDMIEQLAALIQGGQYRRRTRLILVDYPADLPQVTPATVLTETLVLSDALTHNDLIPCIAASNELRQLVGLPGLLAAEIPLMAQQIAAEAPTSGKERLQFFNDELLGLLEVEPPPPTP